MKQLQLKYSKISKQYIRCTMYLMFTQYLDKVFSIIVKFHEYL